MPACQPGGVLRYHFDVVCPYSYLLMPEVEAAQDAGTPVEFVPFELRPAPDPLPDPRGTYIRDHWRDHVYGLAATHEIEMHVPRSHPRSRLALTLHWFAEEKGRGRAYRDAAHRAFFVEGLNLADESVARSGTGGEPGRKRSDSSGLGSPEDLGSTSYA